MWKLPNLILLVVLILSLAGLLFVFEASVAESFHLVGHPYLFLKQQAIRMAIGWVGLVVAMLIPLKWWQKSAPIWYWLGIALLVLVLIPGIGTVYNGARRWLVLGGFVLQPVEVFKLGCVMYFAEWMSRHQSIKSFGLLTFLPAVLIILQPDLGSLLVVLGVSVSLYFLADCPLQPFLKMCGAGVVALIGAVISSPYRLKRVTTYLNPESDPLGASFHIRQITLALGNGGWFGQGLGNSRQKYAYIPEASTDSIFAIIAEEIGFFGSLVVLALFGWFLSLGWRVTKGFPNRSFEQLLAGGIVTWFGVQLVLNIASVVALVPLTGVPLPFISYGGSALLMNLIASGILIRLARESIKS